MVNCVRRRQNFVVAVAACAVRRDGGTVLRGEAVVAFKKSGHAVAGRLYFVFSRSDAWQRLHTSSEMLMVEVLLSDRILWSS